MMRVPLVAGNWKMQGSMSLLEAMIPALLSLSSSCEVALFPSFVYLPQAQALMKGSALKLGAQNVSERAEGAYTGEVSAEMLAAFGCDYVLVGHSERRQFFHETDDVCVTKMIRAQKMGLTPILCIGETLEEREGHRAQEVIERQLRPVFDHPELDAKKMVLAYEPVWAIGTGKTATSTMAEEMHAFIREKLGIWVGNDIASRMRILYGGSVKPENAVSLLSQSNIDGALVGGASLAIDSFLGIIRSIE